MPISSNRWALQCGAAANEGPLWREVYVGSGSFAAVARSRKQSFGQTFAPTTADRHVAAVRLADRQRLLRPSCTHKPSGRFPIEAAAQVAGLRKRQPAAHGSQGPARIMPESGRTRFWRFSPQSAIRTEYLLQYSAKSGPFHLLFIAGPSSLSDFH